MTLTERVLSAAFMYEKYKVWSVDCGPCCWPIYQVISKATGVHASVQRHVYLLQSLFDLHKVSLKAFGRKLKNVMELDSNPRKQIPLNMIIQHIINSFSNSFQLISDKNIQVPNSRKTCKLTAAV